jgi:protein pelota
MLGARRDQTTGGDEGGRAKSAERKKMWIRLSVESIEYQSFSEILRIHGIITEAQIDIGCHHTHNILISDDIEVTSNIPFKNTDKTLLQQAIDASNQVQVALAVIENDEVILFYVTPRGLKESTTWTMRGGGKRVDAKSSSGVASNFRAKVIKELTESLGDETPLILCGPGHARDTLLQELRQNGQTRFMTSISTSMSGRSGANEVLREGLAGNLLEQYAITKEIALLEQAWTRLSTKGAVAYGQQELLKALEEGAIETALISADLLRDEDAKIGDVTWAKWADGLEDIGAELIQCSTDHDSGQQLLGMGGAIALLRYRM